MKNLTHAYVAGGGVKNNPLKSLSTTPNHSKRFFTPIVASSLALFLSAGVANAAASACPTSVGGDPKICYEYRQSDRNPTGNLTAATISGLSWTDNNNVLTPQASGQNLNYLEFQFNAGTGDAPSGADAGTGGYRIQSGGIGLTQVIVLDGGTKGIEMGKQTDGTAGKLSVIFGQGVDSRREFHLNLSKSTGDFSFKGNIVIQAGKGNPSKVEENSKFVGDFGKKVIGDIVVSNRNDSGNQSRHRTELNFSSGADLQGSLTTKAGTTTATFAGDSSITGNVSASGGNKPKTYAAKNIITFSGSGTNTIGGNITSDSATNNITAATGTLTIGSENSPASISVNGGNPATNDITAQTIDLKLSSMSATGNGNATNTNTITSKGALTMKVGSLTANKVKGGGNTITSEGKGDATITGDMSAASAGKNSIELKGANSTFTLNGNITNNAGTNEITVKQGTLTIDSSSGKIEAGGGGTANNTISAKKLNLTLASIAAVGNRNSTNNNTITSTESLNMTIGSLKAEGLKAGGNTITANGTGNNTATINGDMTAAIGNNTVELKGANSTFTLNGNISSNAGANKILVEQGTITIGSEATPISMTTNGGGTATNEIIGKTIDMKLSSMSASNSGNNTNTNKITAKETLTLSVGSISANDPRSENIIVSEGRGDVTVTGGVSATIGKNSIELRDADSTLTLNGNITNNAGTNEITVKQGTLTINSNSGKIEASGGGTATNNIAAKTLDLALASISAIGGGTNTNTIIGGSGTITAKDITASGARNANNIGLGSSANGDSKLIANVVANSSGTNNIILENAAWESGNLTSNGGTNNLVLRKVTAGGTPYAQGADTTYRVNTNSGANNIVVQGADTQMQINYGKSGTTTLIFASKNDAATDSFASDSTSVNANKVLGKTYQDGFKLSLQDKTINVGNGQVSFIDTYGKFFRDKPDAPLLTLKTESTAGTTNVTLTGLVIGSLKALDSAGVSLGGAYKLNLSKDSAFVGDVDLSAATSTTINLVMESGSKFLTDNQNLTLKNLTFNNASFNNSELLLSTFEQGNTIVDIATMGNDLGQLATRSEFRLLTIGDASTTGNNTGLQGNDGLFRVYVNKSGDATGNKLGGVDASNGSNSSNTYGYAYSDRILIHEGTEGKQHIQAILDSGMTAEDLSKITYKEGTGTDTAGNIAIATVKTDTNITFEGAKQLQGFDVVGTILDKTDTDENGKVSGVTTKDYTTYFIKSMGAEGISLLNQKLTASALFANYDLYLANINSLNKRMGELRENTGAQGVWARVFNGMQSTNFALDTRAIYTTIQGGYDYTFGFKGASNYLGFALSYANSMSKLNGDTSSLIDIDNKFKSLTGMNSNAFEFAIYNAYVQDGASKATGFKNGLYTDTIAKFSYIMSNLDITGEDKLNTQNFAFTFSQELGYRFLLGNDKEFYIDPQAEITLGYLNQSNLTRVLGKAFLKANQDSILTLRSRVGSSFGYKFDKFTQNKGFNSSLYLGTYFVSDVIAGGDIFMQSNLSQASFKALESTARFVLNLGTNFKIKDNTRIYFDFERSFGGKITTDYQLNLGVRYSFGASKYTPYTETTQEAPKDNNTLKEVEPTKGYYIELLEKEDKKLTSKELKTLQNLKEELRIQTKTQNSKTLKTYLAGPYKDEKKAKEAKAKLEGVIKELKGKGSIVEVE